MTDLKSISDELNKAVIDNEDTLNRLREENKRLKDDHYKDEELQLMEKFSPAACQIKSFAVRNDGR